MDWTKLGHQRYRVAWSRRMSFLHRSFSQKNPIISGSFAKNDLQLKSSHGFSPPCTAWVPQLPHLIRQIQSRLGQVLFRRGAWQAEGLYPQSHHLQSARVHTDLFKKPDTHFFEKNLTHIVGEKPVHIFWKKTPCTSFFLTTSVLALTPCRRQFILASGSTVCRLTAVTIVCFHSPWHRPSANGE